ncbi:MAG: winged helix-turn-helix transcriptional regulator [Betaproteobacteria bacterium]|nr:winged helix-turn-helix transcriptional regulator [Betaproteobacteria bacterium]
MSRNAAPHPGARLNPGPLPELIGYRLRLAQQSVFRDFAASVPGLSPGRVGMLLLIEANPGVTQSRLAHAVDRDRSTMVGVLDQLEARGLIERRKGEDRRTNALWLTRPGRNLLARAKRAIAIHERRIASRLSVAERDKLLELLARIAA